MPGHSSVAHSDIRSSSEVPVARIASSVSMSFSSPAYPSYQSHPNSLESDPNLPPAPPPKPGSQEVSRHNTPAGSQPLPPPPQTKEAFTSGGGTSDASLQHPRARDGVYSHQMGDPGDNWLPKVLEDKSSVT